MHLRLRYSRDHPKPSFRIASSRCITVWKEPISFYSIWNLSSYSFISVGTANSTRFSISFVMACLRPEYSRPQEL